MAAPSQAVGADYAVRAKVWISSTDTSDRVKLAWERKKFDLKNDSTGKIAVAANALIDVAGINNFIRYC